MKNRHIREALADGRVNARRRQQLIVGARIIKRLNLSLWRGNPPYEAGFPGGYGLTVHNCLAVYEALRGLSRWRGRGKNDEYRIIEEMHL